VPNASITLTWNDGTGHTGTMQCNSSFGISQILYGSPLNIVFPGHGCMGATGCNPKFKFTITKPNGSTTNVNQTSPNLAILNITDVGSYTIDAKYFCGNNDCKKVCNITIDVKQVVKKQCDCRALPGQKVTVNWNNGTQQSSTIPCNNPNDFAMSDVIIGTPISGVISTFTCFPASPSCQPTYVWNVTIGVTIIQSGTTANFSFLPSAVGEYVMDITTKCNGVSCGVCNIKMLVKRFKPKK